jgi:porphobilinogen synthase
MSFPVHRLRRLRRSEAIRRMVRENNLTLDDLVCPLFVVHGSHVKKEITSLPGNYHLSIDSLIEESKAVADCGIPAILLFGIPDHKDEFGSAAYDPRGIVQEAVRAIKSKIHDLVVITDVCLCEYTAHGHCGVLKSGYVDNDSTLELVAKIALTHAEAGSDIVAPSCRMDGHVQRIRTALDEKGFQQTLIMSYAAKYASHLYSPFFKEAVRSMLEFGDKRSHQLDYANGDEAIRQVGMDLAEGSDIVIVKPGLAYLDIAYRVKEKFGVPVAIYNVSGEYAMLHAAKEKGFINAEAAMLEFLVSFKRAGVDIIITYAAKEAARLLGRQQI